MGLTEVEIAIAILKAMTIVLCPRLKYNPQVMGRVLGRRERRVRVALSIALIWSASSARRQEGIFKLT